MEYPRAKHILWLGFLLLVAACKSTDLNQPPPTDSSPVELAAELPPAYTANPEIGESERFYYALQLLEQGQEEQARVELEAFLVHQPKSQKARELIRQIDTPVYQYFPSEFFEVTLQPGESLSVLARDYLDDLYAFYALAKYNSISVPSQINAGQKIRIPSTASAVKHRKTLAETVQGESPQAAEQPSVAVAPKSNQVVSEQTVDHQALITAALAEDDFASAVEYLEQLRESPGLSTDQQRQAADIYRRYAASLEDQAPQQAAWYYFESAKLTIRLETPDAALPALQKSLALNPDNPTASEIYTILKYELTDRYQRKADIAYANQQLALAIELWTRVLEIDPDHAQARKRLAEAQALQSQQQQEQQEQQQEQPQASPPPGAE